MTASAWGWTTSMPTELAVPKPGGVDADDRRPLLRPAGDRQRWLPRRTARGVHRRDVRSYAEAREPARPAAPSRARGGRDRRLPRRRPRRRRTIVDAGA